MPRAINFVPKYCHHKASGLAIVTISGKDHYLGPWKSRASRIEYDRLVGEWIANGRTVHQVDSGSLTVSEVAAAYWKFAQGYYRKEGHPTGAIPGIKIALRLLRQLYGHTPASSFGPLALAALRQRLVDTGNSRTYINDHMGRVKRIFKWAASQELVPVSVHQALATLAGLRKGRTTAREPEPIGPVDDAVVEATLPHLRPIVADMVRFQRATGARPAEVCLVRPADVDRSGKVWAFRPRHHKTEHLGRERVVFIGPNGQDILRPYLLRKADDYCFVPAESEASRKAVLRSLRKTPVQPSQINRRKRKPKRLPGNRYTTESYRRAIHRAAAKAGVDLWSPNRLRHAAATEIRSKFGLEAAATVLGHAKADVTQIYAERDLAKAAAVMAEVG